jgi:hypothetical protein
MCNTLQGGVIEGNAADDALVVDQGFWPLLDFSNNIQKNEIP